MVPTATPPGDEFHATGPRESGWHETDRATRSRHAQWRQVYDLIRSHATNLALFKLTKVTGQIASYKEHIGRSKGEARVVELANRRSCAWIQCSDARKAGNMPVRIAVDRDLIDAADPAARCAGNEQRIRVVILECKTTIVRLHSNRVADADQRVVRIERRSDRGLCCAKGIGQLTSGYG